MNVLELRFSKLDDENPGTDYFPEYKEKYLGIFNKYCTNKKRSYGGQGDSYGEPAQYDGIEDSIEQKIFDFGDNDLHIGSVNGDLKILLCHESDIHIDGNSDDLIQRIAEKYPDLEFRTGEEWKKLNASENT